MMKCLGLFLCLLFIFSILHLAECSIYEMRCKCVCPKDEKYEQFTANRTVFIKLIGGPSECTCRYVVGSDKNDTEYEQDVLDICNQCQCSYEQRLHFINQLMISLTLIFLFAMCVYTLVVVIVNFVRGSRRQPVWIRPNQDEEFRSHSYKTVIRNRLSRWQDQVAKQRNVVYGIPLPKQT